MKTAFVRLALLLSLLVSCAPVRDRKTLNEMEALMPERPDSALAVLQGLQPRDLPGLHVRPLHALLLSEALDKNYIDLTDDSLALAANRFYGSHGSKLHRLKSWYYLGRIRFNSGNYAEAVICYNKALEYAESLENYHYIGLINREIANTYSEGWDDYHATEHIKKSIDAFNVSGEGRYCVYSQIALAKLYYRQKQFDLCNELLESIESVTDDQYILSQIFEIKGQILLFDNPEPDPSLLEEYFFSAEASSVPHTVSRFSDLAYAYQLAGNTDSADFYLSKAFSSLSSPSEKLLYNNGLYRIESARGQYKEANRLLEEMYSYQDSSVINVLKQSLSFQHRNYYQSESRAYATKVKYVAVTSILIFTVLSLILLGLILLNRKQKEDILNEIALTSEIREQLSAIQREKKDMDKAMTMLFENRLRILQTLSEQYDSLMDSHQEGMHEIRKELTRDEIISSFRDKLRELRKDKDIASSMESILDTWKNGIMSKFRSIFAEDSTVKIKMTKEDFALVPYLFSNMKQQTISYLTNYSEHAVRERKRRIRRKIEALDDSFSVEKRLFLDNL